MPQIYDMGPTALLPQVQYIIDKFIFFPPMMPDIK